jgi:recombination protein RecT
MTEIQEKQTGSSLALVKKDVVDVVSSKIDEYIGKGELFLPAGYSPENALKSAWLELQSVTDKSSNPALAVCRKDSIANALFDMVVQGLTPAKKQCYFIVYGKQLTLVRSYFGTAGVAKRILKLKNLFAEVVYDGDVFEYEILHDNKEVTVHKQKLGNINSDKMIAAYCTLFFSDGRPDYTEIMTIDQIKKAWKRSKMDTNEEGGTHKEFPDQMAKRTVINRACKLAVNMSDDSDVLIESFNRSSGFIADNDEAAAQLSKDAAELANGEIIDIDVDIPAEGHAEELEQEQMIK